MAKADSKSIPTVVAYVHSEGGRDNNAAKVDKGWVGFGQIYADVLSDDPYISS